MKVWLINYDNGSRWPVMPQNLYHLSKCLDVNGIDSEVLDFNLTKERYESINHIIDFSEDGQCIIGLGFIAGYWPHREAQKIAKIINAHPRRNKIGFVIGGHGPSADPGYYLELLNADAVFVGSADVSFPLWVKDFQLEPDLQCIIPSEGFRMWPQFVDAPAAMKIYKRVSFPNTRADEFAIQILSARGCPNRCTFCYRVDDGYKMYPIDNILEAVKAYHFVEKVTHFQFSDELLTVSYKRLRTLLSGLREVQEQLGADLFFDCNGRIDFFAKHPELLREMKYTGFRYINFGCESMDNDVLKNIRKNQTVSQIRFAVEATLSAGLSAGLNFMWGNPGDSEQSLRDAMKFIIEYNDGCELRTIRPVTPYPGTELFKSLNITTEEFYKNHSNSDLFSYNFMDLTTTEANMALNDANAEIIAAYYKEKVKFQVAEMNALATGKKDPFEFRGFREV